MSQHWNRNKVVIFPLAERKKMLPWASAFNSWELFMSRCSLDPPGPIWRGELMDDAHASIYFMEKNLNNTTKHFVIVVHIVFNEHRKVKIIYSSLIKDIFFSHQVKKTIKESFDAPGWLTESMALKKLSKLLKRLQTP